MNAKDLRDLAEAARPAIRAALDAAEELATLRDAASEKGVDWSQLKSLLKAQEQDARDDKDRVGKIIERADFACSYADMLGLKDEREIKTHSSSIEATCVGGDPGPIPAILDRRASARI